MKQIKANEEFIFNGICYKFVIKTGNIPVLQRIGPAKNVKEKKSTKEFIPPTLKEVEDFFTSKGYTKEHAKKAFDHYSLGEPPWTDSRGTPVHAWKQKMNINWLQGDEGKIKKKETTNTISFFPE